MRVAIPTEDERGLDSTVDQHFGRAPVYTILDTESDAVETVENDSHHFGGSGHPPEIVADAGVEVVLAGDIGRGAVSRFEDRGIPVFRGATGTVAEAIEDWEAAALEQVGPDDVHGHGHEHGDHTHDHDHSHDPGDHAHDHSHDDAHEH